MRTVSLTLVVVAAAVAHAAGARRGRRVERAATNRYLHDAVLPTLEAFALAGPADADRAPEKLADLRRAARAQAAALRRDLLPQAESTPDCGLTARLRPAIAEAERQGLRVDLVAEIDPALPRVRGVAVREAIRESLRNTRKHAGVDRAQVLIVERSGGFAVIARDRGAGFRVGEPPGGFGLRESIVARMAEVGGSARIESRPGQGTTITVWVPR